LNVFAKERCDHRDEVNMSMTRERNSPVAEKEFMTPKYEIVIYRSCPNIIYVSNNSTTLKKRFVHKTKPFYLIFNLISVFFCTFAQFSAFLLSFGYPIVEKTGKKRKMIPRNKVNIDDF